MEAISPVEFLEKYKPKNMSELKKIYTIHQIYDKHISKIPVKIYTVEMAFYNIEGRNFMFEAAILPFCSKCLGISGNIIKYMFLKNETPKEFMYKFEIKDLIKNKLLNSSLYLTALNKFFENVNIEKELAKKQYEYQIKVFKLIQIYINRFKRNMWELI